MNTNPEKTVLELKGIRKRFKNIEALTGIDLKISQGEFFGFLGPNGAGKSTLMKILSGFLEADEGMVLIKGREVEFRNHGARRTCGLVPQEIALYDSLSPLENIQCFARLYSLSKQETRERGRRLLEQVGLWDRRNDLVKDFSGGMKRRLNIIVSLLHRPDILLCDEPTVGVDPQSRNAIFEFLESLNKEGLTVLYTTHYMEEAERLCPRIAIIDHGNILACGEQAELLKLTGIEREVVVPKVPDAEALVENLRPMGKVVESDNEFRLIPAGNLRLSELYKIVEDSRISDNQIRVIRPTLESLFLKLTGNQLRE